VEDDIVARLRQIPTAWPLVREAADEIERLRVQALGTQRRIQDQDAIMAELWERIYALTTERDEARREVCNLRPSVCLGAQTAVEFANHRGWDCFKDDGK
jgi:hypothetical protein